MKHCPPRAFANFLLALCLSFSGCAYPFDFGLNKNHPPGPEAVHPGSPEAIHPSSIDEAAGEVPSFGLRRGLTRGEVYQLLGRPVRTHSSAYSETWYFGEFSNVTFNDRGCVDGWDESKYDQSVGGFRGFPIDFGSSVAYVAPPVGPLPEGVRYSPYFPRVAENNSFFGELSADVGAPKTVYVRGYFRHDGTYVQSHYRSRPHR